MKKIMFNDRYGLTQAVLDGRKTMTRRIITCPKSFKGEWVAGFNVHRRLSDNQIIDFPCMYDADEREFDGGEILPKYKVGEIVAIAQRYRDLIPNPISIPADVGWFNKLFVRADLMPHQIRITNVRVEKLQDISDEDCIKEGIVKWTKDRELFKYDLSEHYEMFEWSKKPHSPREAYAALIDRISGKGTWDSNPFVFVYEFELVK